MKIYTFADKGGLYARGAVEVGGFNVSPIVLTTTADVTVAEITDRMADKANWFNVTTNAATDDIVLPPNAEVGTKLVVLPAGGCGLTVTAGGTINGVADGESSIADGERVEATCIGVNTWTAETITAGGVRAVATAV